MPDDRSNAQAAPDPDPLPCYANFCQLVSTPEEVLFDFATVPESATAVPVAFRVAMQYPAAARLAQALQAAVERHEQLFGHLEPAPAKRVVPGLHPPEEDWLLG